jgi:hypothetical protein
MGVVSENSRTADYAHWAELKNEPEQTARIEFTNSAPRSPSSLQSAASGFDPSEHFESHPRHRRCTAAVALPAQLKPSAFRAHLTDHPAIDGPDNFGQDAITRAVVGKRPTLVLFKQDPATGACPKI